MKKTARGKLTRNDQLSCSQLPALFGESPYQTPNDVLRACCAAMSGQEPANIENEAMAWGSLLEEPVAEEAAARLQMDLEHGFDAPFQATNLALACSLDGKLHLRTTPTVIKSDPAQGLFVMTDTGELEVSDTGILEVKVTSSAPDDSPPLHRGPLQLQGQMICTGARWGAIATLYRGTEMRIFVFPAHVGTQERIAFLARDFESRLMDFANTGVENWYPLQSVEDGARTFPKAEPKTIELPAEAAGHIATIQIAKEKISLEEERLASATKALMDIMGEAEVAVYGHTQVVWGSRSYKAQPEKVVPAKEAYTVRNKTLQIKEAK